MTLFTRSDGTSQLHFSSTPLNVTVNAPNYTSLMDFIHGNLQDYLNPTRTQHLPKVAPEVRFNPAMRFGPPPGAETKFRLTIAIPRVSFICEAHPREWNSASPTYGFVGSMDRQFLKPFLHLSASNLLMDYGTLTSGDSYISICTTSLDAQDLRLGYRLTEVSSRVPSAPAELDPTSAHGSAAVRAQLVKDFVETHMNSAGSTGRRRSMEIPFGANSGMPAVAASGPGSLQRTMTATSDSEVFHSPRESVEFLSDMSDMENDETMEHDDTMEFELQEDELGTPHTPRSGFSFDPANYDNEYQVTPSIFEGGPPHTDELVGQASMGAPEEKPPQTGIKLSIARRTSQPLQPDRPEVATATPSVAGLTPGRLGPSGQAAHFLPVVDFVSVPGVEESEDSAVLRILTAPHKIPKEESMPAMIDITRLPGSNPNVRLEVNVGMLADSTVAVEVALSNALVQWPYFQDLSLVRVDSLFALVDVPSNITASYTFI